MVPCVLVSQAAFAVRVENTACPAHRLPVERTVVDVDTVDAHVFDHPVQSFEVIVVPARLGIGDDRDIELTLVFALFEARIPGRNIVLAHVVDEPWSRTVRIDDRSGIVTGPVFDDLVAKAAEHPEFGGFDRQLTAGVIEAYFQVVRMRFRDEGFHIGHDLVYHRIVDVGIDVRFVVYVDPFRSGFQRPGNESAARVGVQVVGTVGEMSFQVDRFDRRYEQVEIEIELFARFERSLSAVCVHLCGICLFGDIDSSLIVVTPRMRVPDASELVIDIHERAFVVAVLENDLHTRVDITQPDAVLLFDRIPFPVDRRIGACTAFHTEAHDVFRCVVRIIEYRTDIFDLDIAQCGHFQLVVDRSVEQHFCKAFRFYVRTFEQNFPLQCGRGLFEELDF